MNGLYKLTGSLIHHFASPSSQLARERERKVERERTREREKKRERRETERDFTQDILEGFSSPCNSCTRRLNETAFLSVEADRTKLLAGSAASWLTAASWLSAQPQSAARTFRY